MREKSKSTLDMDENVEALLSYAGGWITGLIFLLVEKENKFVRFHAMQSFITFLFLMIIFLVSGMIPFIGPFLVFIVSIIILVLWIILMIKTYRGERYKLPIIGDIVERQLAMI